MLRSVMADVPARDLRNKVSEVLRRVQSGERLRITVSGRPVAELAPLGRKPRSMRADEFWPALFRAQADPQLADDLRSALPDTTDDVESR
jgi:prevent-host-death family protein